MYGEGAVTDWMWEKWFVKFRAGEFLQGHAPGSGRPVEVDSDQSQTLTENNQHYTMRERADILKISKSIKLSVKMKNVSVILQKNLTGLLGQPNILLFPRLPFLLLMAYKIFSILKSILKGHMT